MGCSWSYMYIFSFFHWLFSVSFKGSIFFNPLLSGSPYFHLSLYQSVAHKLCAFHGLKIKKYFYHNSKILDFSLSFSYKYTVAFSREYVIDHLITEIKCWGDLRGWLGNLHCIIWYPLNVVLCLLIKLLQGEKEIKET